MKKTKPLTIKDLSVETGISEKVIWNSIKDGELVAVIQKGHSLRGRPKWIIDRASAEQYKKMMMKII